MLLKHMKLEVAGLWKKKSTMMSNSEQTKKTVNEQSANA